jgi:hypothetical protein
VAIAQQIRSRENRSSEQIRFRILLVASLVSSDALDERIAACGWKRFRPSGSDLCHKCGSANTIVQVSK